MSKKMNKILLILFSFILSLTTATAESTIYSPSIDCQSKALNNAEKLICKSTGLIKKDNTLNQLYLLALKKSITPEQVIKSQQNWLEQIRNKCTSEDSLMDVYEERERYLGNMAIVDGKFNIPADNFSDARSQWKSNDSEALLAKMKDGFFSRPDLNAKVISCESVWENHTGTINHAYGGICWAEINKKLNEYYVCSNSVSDHFSPVSVRNEYLLVRFIDANCYGG